MLSSRPAPVMLIDIKANVLKMSNQHIRLVFSESVHIFFSVSLCLVVSAEASEAI